MGRVGRRGGVRFGVPMGERLNGVDQKQDQGDERLVPPHAPGELNPHEHKDNRSLARFNRFPTPPALAGRTERRRVADAKRANPVSDPLTPGSRPASVLSMSRS